MVQNLVALLLGALMQTTPVPSPSPSPLPSVAPSPSASASPIASPSAPPILGAQPFVADHLYPGSMLQIAVANASGTINATIDNSIVTWSIDQNAHIVRLTAGQTLGRAVLVVSDGSGQTVQIPVRVGIDAAKVVAQNITLQYTGNPVDQTWLQKTVQKGLLRNVQLQPGATAQMNFNLQAALAPGSVSAFDAQIQVQGNDRYYPVAAAVNVNLQNVAAESFLPPLLFYDDDPEHLAAEGILYRGSVPPGTPARLYYYHENGSQARDLVVVFSTTSGPATVQLIDASAGPNIDVMTVGHAVTRDFLTLKPNNQGIVVSADVQSPYIADRFPMQPIQGAAGNIDVHVLSGGPVEVTVLAVATGTPDSAIPGLLGQPQLPGDGHHRTGVFNIAGYARDSLSYTVGGEDASLDYGLHSPPAADSSGGHDYGEYGVWRTLDFAVSNPTAQPATLYLYEQPMGGPVRSSFFLTGSALNAGLAQVPCARASERYQIGAPVPAPPGQSTIELQTMTDGGSNYPLQVGLTATPPSPSPPPISAPNGCFPKAQTQPSASPSPQPEPTGR